jgi:hypothetical protein
LVWNLTWDDVAAFHKAVEGESLKTPLPRPLLSGTARQSAMRVHNAKSGMFDFDVTSQNPMMMLLDYLRRPDLEQWERLALSATAGAFADSADPHLVASDDVENLIRSATAGSAAWPVDSESPAALARQWANNNGHVLTMLLDAAHANGERWTVISSIPDGDTDVSAVGHPTRWRDWLQWANVLQFLRGTGRAVVIAATSQTDNLYFDELDLVGSVAAAGLPSEPSDTGAAPIVTSLTDAQEDELGYIVGDPIRALVREALFAGAPDFEAGPEYDGEAIEAAWVDQRVGVCQPDQSIVIDGWDIRPVADWTSAELLALLKERS